MADSLDQTCGCGEALHYSDETIEAYMRRMVVLFGPTIPVTVNNRSYAVPRHYIALHGVKAVDLPKLSKRYGWDTFSAQNV